MEKPLNTLYHGDNLDVLRRYVADARIKAFEDTWLWGRVGEKELAPPAHAFRRQP